MAAVSTHPLIGQLRPIFAELHSCTPQSLPSVILKLDYVIEEERDALFHKSSVKSSTNSKLLPNWMDEQLRELFSNSSTQLAGVRVLRALLGVEYVDLNEITKLFSELLVRCVLETTDYGIAIEAAEVWGLLLNNGSSVVGGIVSNCLKFSITLLMRSGHDPSFLEPQQSSESMHMSHHSGGTSGFARARSSGTAYPEATKLSGCLFIDQLVRRVPSAVVSHAESILEGLRRAIIDDKRLVRRSAADALYHTLRISYRSIDPSLCRKWQDVLLRDSLRGLEHTTAAVVHGSLLVFNAVLLSITAHDGDARVVELSPVSAGSVLQVWLFINEHLTRTIDDDDVRQEVLGAMPLLAKYDTTRFKETSVRNLSAASYVAFNTTEGPDQRPLFFSTLANLFTVLPEAVPPFLDRLMRDVELSLVKRPNRDRCLEAVTCFSKIAEVQPKAVRPFLRHILTSLFAGTITEGFARDVANICTAFPELRSTCLSKMLDATKAQLQTARHRSMTGTASEEENTRFILVNLKALGSLDFTGYSTLQFLCEAVVQYVSDPHEEVRRAAIDLCFKLVLSGCSQSPCTSTEAGVVIHRGHEHVRLINTVVRRLINAAVADAESDIRLHTLECFTVEFDHTLALQDIASAIFPALNDKYQNRIVAVRLLGRISSRNPACIYPVLRGVMVQCVTDVQLFNIPKKQEQAIALLSAVVEAAPGMVRPYVSSLLNDCVARLKEPQQPVQMLTALLSCIGQLARYAEGDDVAVLKAIRPFVIGHILDSSNILKKQEAIHALGSIIRTTKDVNVYETNPELLRVLLSALHGGFKETWPIRADVLKLMGIIGAVDPVRVKEISRGLRDNGIGLSDAVLPAGSRGEDAVAQNVMKNVLEVLRLPSLSDDQCIRAIQVIANVLSLKEVSHGCLATFYPDILSLVLQRTCVQLKIRDKLLALLTRIAYLLGQHIRPYLKTLLSTAVTFLPSVERSVLVEVLRLLVQLRRSLREEFRPQLSGLLPSIITALQADAAMASEPIFAFFINMGSLLDDHLHNVLPYVCEVAGNPTYPLTCRFSAVNAIGHFAKHLPRLAAHATRCIHCLCDILRELGPAVAGVITLVTAANHSLSSVNPQASSSACSGVETLAAITLEALRDTARNLGVVFAKFTPSVYPILDMYGAAGLETRNFIATAVRMSGHVLPLDPSTQGVSSTGAVLPLEETAGYTYHASGQRRSNAAGEDHFALLKNVLVARDRETEEDWNLWLRQLSVELLRSSPSLSHEFAYPLAQVHEPFARHMLHSAFAVCYGVMDAASRDIVTSLLGAVLRGERVPSEVLQELLNLSEYMERLGTRFNPRPGAHGTQIGLLFDLKTLMESSERCNLYSKALHYVEIQFYRTTHEYERSVIRGQPRPLPPEEWRGLLSLCEKSIYLCNLLGQRESAEGILKYIQLNFSSLTGKPPSELPHMMDAQLFEKLQWWTQSYRAYQQGLQADPNKFANMVGLMRSLDSLGDYGRLLDAWKLFSPRVGKKELSELSPYGAHAAWLLRCWTEMERITESMPNGGYVGTTAVFYRAVLATHKGRFHDAEHIIQLCRKRLDSTLSALVAESYDRAYGLFVGIQQLCELEEFAFVAKDPQQLGHWQELWEKRLGAMAYEGWPGTLANHTLVIPPKDELGMWLRFVSLSRIHGRERASSEVLYGLLGSQTIASALEQPTLPSPVIALAAFQHLYDTQERDEAVELLDRYVREVDTAGVDKLTPENKSSFAMCHSKIASWLFTQKSKKGFHAPEPRQLIEHALYHLEEATSLDKANGAIWHAWARLNHEVSAKAREMNFPRADALEHIVRAIDGYIRSVCLSEELEDILGFLSLWFTHGSLPQILHNKALKAEIHKISPTVWLKVIPQIIARISSNDAVLSESVYHLLVIVAKAHPQALLYNLNVTNSSVRLGDATVEQLERKQAAQRILTRIVDLHPDGRTLVNDAALVSEELVRCAVLWTELWFDELERAWFQWGREKNAHNILLALRPLLEQLKAPETMAESHFVMEFGELLSAAYESVEKAASLGSAAYMEEAWNRFKVAVKRMDEQIGSMSSLALQLVSPKLLQYGRDLSLVVPGQYNENGHFPRIASFQSTLKVMNSKQHPRRLYLDGTDGVLYKFLLKGHEDLRLDERVMQLLAFANTLLEKHSAIQRRDCLIQVYSVTPLSDNAGLVGWVDHCNTLHQLIKEYRVHSKYLAIELNLMLSMNNDLDRLTVIQHVEPFEFALEQTEGTDLAHSLWMRAPSAESWLDRRTTYVCSLATMSMVGHVLGLGDRHPSNLMIHNFSGRVVHIDFGDCFEVAQTRSAYPEKVPFRLTRMLTKAMEMGGIEGLFRHGCFTVMSVLREEGSSILALLEAFVHDPLVSWWREDPDTEEDESRTPAATEAFHTSGDQAYSSLGQSFQRLGSNYTVGSVRTLTHRSLALRQPQRTETTHTATIGQPKASVSPGSLSTSSVYQTRKAQKVVSRIKEKLEGREFPHLGTGRVATSVTEGDGLTVEDQVDRLIAQATATENLCVHFQGWCPFW